MANAITDTAQLTCNQGTMPSNLLVTRQDFITIENKPIATEQDNKPNANIKPFGQCKLKPSSAGYLPCVPAPQKWEKNAEKNTINDDAILTENSFCMCSVGGKISVKDKGHSEIHIFEDEPADNFVQNKQQSSETEKKDTVEEEKTPEVIDGYWINSKGEKINFRSFEETKIRFQFEVNQKAIGNYITFEVMDINITNDYESTVYSKIIELKYNLNQVEINLNKIFEKALNIDRKIKHKLLLYVQLKINKTKVFPKKIKDYLKIFVVEFVPMAMKNQKPSWIVATKLQKGWFSRSKAQKPYYSKPVTNIATMSWIKSFQRVLPMLQDIKNKKWETKASINLFCKRLNEMLLNNDVELPNMLEIKNFGNFDNSQYRSDNKGVKTTLLDRYYVNEVVFSSSIKNHPLDDLYGALGNFVFRITPKGTITFVSKNTYKVSYQKIAIYFMDSFDFQYEIFNWESPKTYISQPLGFWDFANNEVSKIPFPSSTYIVNSVYQDYQNETYKGGDFILISDFEEIEVDFSFYIKRDFLGNFIKI